MRDEAGGARIPDAHGTVMKASYAVSYIPSVCPVLEEAAKENIPKGCVLDLFLRLSTIGVRAPGLDWPGGCLQGVFLGEH